MTEKQAYEHSHYFRQRICVGESGPRKIILCFPFARDAATPRITGICNLLPELFSLLHLIN